MRVGVRVSVRVRCRLGSTLTKAKPVKMVTKDSSPQVIVGRALVVVWMIEKLMRLNLVWPYDGIPASRAERRVAPPPTCISWL